jgi:hypothetical protein
LVNIFVLKEKNNNFNSMCIISWKIYWWGRKYGSKRMNCHF